MLSAYKLYIYNITRTQEEENKEEKKRLDDENICSHIKLQPLHVLHNVFVTVNLPILLSTHCNISFQN